MVLDPETLAVVSEQKIAAYDEMMTILNTIQESAPNYQISRWILLIRNIDETQIQPIETRILEKLFEDDSAAKKIYLGEYQEAKSELKKAFNGLVTELDAYSKQRVKTVMERSENKLLKHILVLVSGVFIVLLFLSILSKKTADGEADIEILLGSIREGLFYFDKNGIISSRSSEELVSLLPGADECRSLEEFFRRFTNDFSENNYKTAMNLFWQNSDDGFYSSFDDTCTMLPNQILRSDNDQNSVATLAIKYKPTYHRQSTVIDKIVVGIEDVTDKLALERQQEQQASRVDRIQKATSNVEAFKNFVAEVIVKKRSIDQCFAQKGDPLILARDLHTLKGNLAMYAFSDIAAKIHVLEGTELCSKSNDCREKWERIKDQWKFESIDIENVIGLRQFDNKILTSRKKIDKLKAVAEKYPELKETVSSLELYPLEEVFQKYVDLVRRLSEKDAYKAAEITFDKSSAELRFAEIKMIDNGLIHIIRNCFDHGIEDAPTRFAAVKSEAGVIQVSCFRTKRQELHLTIKDDGAGIDGEKLAKVALEKSIITLEEYKTMSEQSKIELIFRDSLSSREQATEISGRGVGMSAVLAEVKALGGILTVFSHQGQGTQFEITVPLGQDSKALDSEKLMANG